MYFHIANIQKHDHLSIKFKYFMKFKVDKVTEDKIIHI